MVKSSLRKKPNGALKLMLTDLPILLMKYARANREADIERTEGLLRDVQREVARRGLK